MCGQLCESCNEVLTPKFLGSLALLLGVFTYFFINLYSFYISENKTEAGKLPIPSKILESPCHAELKTLVGRLLHVVGVSVDKYEF